MLVARALAFYFNSRRTPVTPSNVNAEWKGDLTRGLEQYDDQHPPANPGPTVGGNGTAPRFDSDDPTIKANA